MDTLKKQLADVVNSSKSPKTWTKQIKNSKELSELIDPLVTQYNLTIPAAVYCVLNDVTPVCKYNSIKPFTWFKKGFAFCGSRNVCKCNTEESVNKAKHTNILKYGVESYAKTQEYKIKTAATNLSKFGVEKASHSPEIRNRAKQTCIEKYGTEYPSQLPIFVKKAKETRYQKYGDENFSNFEKRKQTLLTKYGVENYNYAVMTDYQKSVLFDKQEFVSFVTGKTKQYAAFSLGVDPNTIRKYIQQYDCESVLDKSKSKWEEVIKSLLDSLNVKYIQNTKKVIHPFELDFFLPEFSLAIECHGNYWHSEKNGKNKKYHFNKWKQCYEQGITLLQYFEDELENSWPVIKSKIQYATNNISKKIGARQVAVRKISFNEEAAFLRQNHIQKETKARSITYGGFHQNELCAVFSIVKRPKYLEIIRFSTTTDAVYPGLFSKMLKFAIADLNYSGEIVSFSDNRHSNGNLYKQSGFIQAVIQGPAYFYTKDYVIRENRQRYMKSKIEKKFNIDVTGKTEFQLMNELNYDKIWDAGKIKWVLTV